jgi:hypothetical protein
LQAKIHSISRFQFFVAVCIFLLFFWLQIEEKNQKLESELERTKNELWTKEKMIVQLKEDAEEAAEKLKKVSTPSKQVSKGPDPRVVELEAKLKDARAELAMMRSGIEVKDKAFLEAQEQEKKVVDQLRAVNRALEERLREAIATQQSRQLAWRSGGLSWRGQIFAGSVGGSKQQDSRSARRPAASFGSQLGKHKNESWNGAGRRCKADEGELDAQRAVGQESRASSGGESIGE